MESKMAKRQRVNFKMSNGKVSFFKPKVEKYYTPFYLGILYIARKWSIILSILIGISLIIIGRQGNIASSICSDMCDYGGCMSFNYPYSFWLFPCLLLLETMFLWLSIYCINKIQFWRWE
jgi:hypothetical protein